MGALVAWLLGALGVIAALVTWVALNALGADGVTIFLSSGGAFITFPGAVAGLVALAKHWDKVP